jgi:hypothetical protein
MPAAPARPVFGVPLKEAVAISRIRTGLELPAVVYRTVEYLEAKNAESEEGIFRLSGSANVIRVSPSHPSPPHPLTVPCRLFETDSTLVRPPSPSLLTCPDGLYRGRRELARLARLL